MINNEYALLYKRHIIEGLYRYKELDLNIVFVNGQLLNVQTPVDYRGVNNFNIAWGNNDNSCQHLGYVILLEIMGKQYADKYMTNFTDQIISILPSKSYFKVILDIGDWFNTIKECKDLIEKKINLVLNTDNRFKMPTPIYKINEDNEIKLFEIKYKDV